MWQYGALIYQWNERHKDTAKVEPPSAEEYEKDKAMLMARGDPRIRLQ